MGCDFSKPYTGPPSAYGSASASTSASSSSSSSGGGSSGGGSSGGSGGSGSGGGGGGGASAVETATITGDAVGILSLELTGQGTIIIDTTNVNVGYDSVSGNYYLYVNLGITNITGGTITSKPILDIFYSNVDSPDNYILKFQNLIIDTFVGSQPSSWICKVEIPSIVANELKNVMLTFKWERPSGGVTTDPIELTQLTKPDIKSEPNFITDDGSMQAVTEAFTNYRVKYLALEGYMDEHPLLGKTYARF